MVKFEFNDISLDTKNDSDRDSLFVSLAYFIIQRLYQIIMIKLFIPISIDYLNKIVRYLIHKFEFEPNELVGDIILHIFAY